MTKEKLKQEKNSDKKADKQTENSGKKFAGKVSVAEKASAKTGDYTTVLSGSEAIAHGVRLCRPQVCPMYPITPSTKIPEKITDFVANGELDTQLILVESEHSALSAFIGASLTGSRTFTASASQGIALMHEIIPIVSGMRASGVMAVGNRTLSSPINIWNDHSDTLSERDQGWIQLYVETCQEALDTIIQAYKLSETSEISLPVMVCLDGFTLTHVFETVKVPAQEKVDKFLPQFKPNDFLDIENPKCFGGIAFPNSFFEFKESQQIAIQKALDLIPKINADYEKTFSRAYGNGLIELIEMQDAEIAILGSGTLIGTCREVVKELRKQGIKAGIIKLKCLRPFPEKDLIEATKKLKAIAVLDRHISLGAKGPIFTEVKALLKEQKILVNGYIAGLGGRDITPSHLKQVYSELKQNKKNEEGWLK